MVAASAGVTRQTNNIPIHDGKVVLMLALKAANTSVKTALHDAGYAGVGAPPFLGFEHWSAAEVAESSYAKIAIIRHPAERLLSTWHAAIMIGGEKVDMLERHKGLICAGMRWAAFVEAVFNIPDRKADPHLRSQCFDRFHRGRYLPQTVFKIESPAETWWPKLRALLPRLPAKMPEENRRKDRPALKELCSQRDIDRIAIRYHADLWLGGYPL